MAPCSISLTLPRLSQLLRVSLSVHDLAEMRTKYGGQRANYNGPGYNGSVHRV